METPLAPDHVMATTQCVDILGDGRLLKALAREGAEDACQPRCGDTVEVHYVCRLSGPEGEIVDSSRERRQPLVCTLGNGELLLGFDHAVASMRQGELATFSLHPDLAYGAAGCGAGAVQASPPADVAATTIHCELELLAVSSGANSTPLVDAEEDFSQMSPEERLEIAMRTKDAGNSHFKVGELARALAAYRSALRALGLPDDGKERTGDEGIAENQAQERIWSFDLRRESRAKLAVSCHLNSCQCCLRLSNNTEAFQHASAALAFEPKNAKALYRRGTAAIGLGLFDRARSDLAEAVRQEPRNAEIRAQWRSCQQQAQNAETKARSTFGGMFDRAKHGKSVGEAS